MEGKNPQKSTIEPKLFKIPIEEYEKEMDKDTKKGKKNEILDLLNNYNKLRSEKEFREIKYELLTACKEGDLDLIKIYLNESITNNSNTLKFKIDKTNQTASLFKVDDNITEVAVPRTIEHESVEYLITSISGTSENLKTLKFVEDSVVKTIYGHAFTYSPKIEEIYFPESLKELKKGWCYQTEKLKKIIISPSNGQFMFKDNKYLLGKSDPSKDEFDILLYGIHTIKEISIPSNVKIISPFAFDNCLFLTKIEFPLDSNLEIIKEFAFRLTSIRTIFIPPTVSKICKYAFNSCYLNYIKFPPDSNLQTIESNAFSQSKICEICIPSKVIKICGCAFANCSYLTKVEIPTNSILQTIGSNAFAGTRIKEIFFPSGLKELKEGWCGNTEYLTKITISPLNGQFIFKDNKYLVGKSDPNKDEFDILLFASRDIKEISIPSNIKIISPDAFGDCKNLVKVDIPQNSNLQTIESFAFKFSKIKEIFIPSNVSKIGERAFFFCEDLERVEIGSNSNLQTIESGLFSNLKIKRIFIPSNVSKIGVSAFENCKKLTKVEIGPNSHLQTIELSAFKYTKIKEIFIPSKVVEICRGAFQDCSNLIKVEIPTDSNLQKIGEKAFSSSKVTSFFIPSKVSEISKDAFYCCGDLQIVEISEESKMETFPLSAFPHYSGIIFMIPTSLEKMIRTNESI